MKALLVATATFALMAAGSVFAQAPANAPAGSTGLCKDGSYSTAPSKSGACSGHKGVKAWYAVAAAAAVAPAPVAAPAAVAPAPAMPMPATKPAAATTTRVAMPAQAAPGGGAGQVWVNDKSKVYHCSSDRYYGKTKHGEYMTEADAVAKGNHPSAGKSCN